MASKLSQQPLPRCFFFQPNSAPVTKVTHMEFIQLRIEDIKVEKDEPLSTRALPSISVKQQQDGIPLMEIQRQEGEEREESGDGEIKMEFVDGRTTETPDDIPPYIHHIPTHLIGDNNNTIRHIWEQYNGRDLSGSYPLPQCFPYAKRKRSNEQLPSIRSALSHSLPLPSSIERIHLSPELPNLDLLQYLHVFPSDTLFRSSVSPLHVSSHSAPSSPPSQDYLSSPSSPSSPASPIESHVSTSQIPLNAFSLPHLPTPSPPPPPSHQPRSTRPRRANDYTGEFKREFGRMIRKLPELRSKWERFWRGRECTGRRPCIKSYLVFCDMHTEFSKLKQIHKFRILGTRTNCECGPAIPHPNMTAIMNNSNFSSHFNSVSSSSSSQPQTPHVTTPKIASNQQIRFAIDQRVILNTSQVPSKVPSQDPSHSSLNPFRNPFQNFPITGSNCTLAYPSANRNRARYIPYCAFADLPLNQRIYSQSCF